MLLMLAIYAVAIGLKVPLDALILGFGMLVTLGMLLIYGLYLRASRAQVQAG
jgi:hypothetical protein